MENSPHNQRTRTLSIRAKSFLFLIGLVFLIGVVSFMTVESSLNVDAILEQTIAKQLPQSRVIQEVSFTLLDNKNKIDNLLLSHHMGINNAAETKLDPLSFSASVDKIDALFAALAWGSETNAFRQSNDGKNFEVWASAGFSRSFVTPVPDYEQGTLAGLATIYFGGYKKYALLLYSFHQANTDGIFSGDATSTVLATQEAIERSSYYLDLTIETLSEISTISNDQVLLGLTAITEVQGTALRNMILLSVLGIFFIVLFGYFFITHMIISPITELTKGAKKFTGGDYDYRIPLVQDDEVGVLAKAFNEMAHSIKGRTSENVRRLEYLLKEQSSTAKLLIRRDLELRRANDQLTQLDREKSEFVSIAAHQLRTPLSAIRWAQQMLIDGDIGTLTKAQIDILAQSQHSIARMVNLVSDLLNADHLEFGQVVYEFKKDNIVPFLSDLFKEFLPMAKERQISFSFNEPQTDVECICDVEKLKEVFSNLINNALKYTPAHGSVQLSLSTKGDMVVVTLSDTGIGIPKEDYHNLFKKFMRSENAKKIDADGSGLGLFIAKKIIDAHCGTISYESAEEVGTTFTILLPQKGPH